MERGEQTTPAAGPTDEVPETPANDPTPAPDTDKGSGGNPVRRITLVVLVAVLLLFTWYLVADRFTPMTDLGRVHAFVVPIAPRVSGIVESVNVEINDVVQEGDVLLRIDPTDYELAVAQAEQNLAQAGQEVGANAASVASAEARLADAEANLSNTVAQTARTLEVERRGVVSRSEGDKARAQLAQARAQVDNARAELQRARETLGIEGDDNPRLRAAALALTEARIDLERTTLRAPSFGAVTNIKIDAGNYASAGTPLMTFISVREIWVEAAIRENGLGHIKRGDPVEIVLDSAPGRIFDGRVVGIGYGVQTGKKTSGQAAALPEVEEASGWLRDPQRFPVIIRFESEVPPGLKREGGQADVIVYTGDHPLLNFLGRLWIRLVAYLSYAY